MSIAALFAWILTVFGGLVLLMIWIIEYDSEFQGSAATRLPVPVISTHALLGMGGLALWFSYILIDQDRLAWASVAVVGTAAVLGLAMAARWVRVYRSFARPGPGLASKRGVPPERNFPLPVVIAHGLLAVTTIVLVLVTTLGGSLCPVTGRRLARETLQTHDVSHHVRPGTESGPGPASGPRHDSAPGSSCSRGRAVAGAQVASRRKAQHGSSRTVFHEGSELSPGDTNASTGVKNARPARAIPAPEIFGAKF